MVGASLWKFLIRGAEEKRLRNTDLEGHTGKLGFLGGENQSH